jgi:nitrogen regulatory protein PII
LNAIKSINNNAVHANTTLNSKSGATIMSQQVWKLVIVAEEVLSKKLTKLIKEAGATGYTVMAAGGEGNRNVRSTGDPSVSHTLSNVKIEVLTGTRELADKITHQIETKYYADYSIITYISQVEALRDHKF